MDFEPTVIDLEPQAAEVAELEKTPPVAENAEEVTAEADPDKSSEEKKTAGKTFTEEEVNKIVQKRLSKFERKVNQQIESVQQKAEPEPIDLPEPNVDDYANYADYVKDLAKYTYQSEKIRDEQAQSKAKSQASQQSEQQRREERYTEITEAGIAKYDDFEELPARTAAHLRTKGLAFDQAMVNTLLEAENAPDIVHYLYANQAEAERIAALAPFAQAKEIGKLEDKLLAKLPVKASNAPKPIEPIGSSSGSAKALEDMSPAEYIEARKKQKPRWA